MINKDMTKAEIEKNLEGKGDFVRIDHLERFLSQEPAIEKRKFVFLKLAEIYEKKGMFIEAAKAYNGAAIASVIFREKIEYYVKEAEFFIKAGEFERADEAMKKSFVQANSTQRKEIYDMIKDFMKRQGERYEKESRRNKATKIYEKLLSMKISDEERQEIKEKLLRLYEKTGKMKEYFALEKGRY